jgi:hypothetical protein
VHDCVGTARIRRTMSIAVIAITSRPPPAFCASWPLIDLPLEGAAQPGPAEQERHRSADDRADDRR